ncbi:hypothetical protein [Bacillus cereus group sp. MYBK227-1]|uniref:hypothetical protein n=1 Tax=Bacillus cereus group sp. MYBK227-1 TaxID=3450654 RepID=UPI003F78ECA2
MKIGMGKYVEDALEIIQDNYLYFLSREYKNFIINIKTYETINSFINLGFIQNNPDVFIDLGRESNNITNSDYIKILNDRESDQSLHTICSENTFKNFVSVLEDFLKEILEFLFNNYPHHVFQKKEKIELNQLLQYDSLDLLKEKIIKEKIIALSYNNLAEMISYIEKEFNVNFEFPPEIIGALVEITSIRNILVHNKGVINERFLEKHKGKEQYFVEEPYELDMKIVMSASEMGNIFEMLEKLGLKIFKALDKKFNNSPKK